MCKYRYLWLLHHQLDHTITSLYLFRAFYLMSGLNYTRFCWMGDILRDLKMRPIDGEKQQEWMRANIFRTNLLVTLLKQMLDIT